MLLEIVAKYIEIWSQFPFLGCFVTRMRNVKKKGQLTKVPAPGCSTLPAIGLGQHNSQETCQRRDQL
jgi:hypothetical protein